MDLHAHREDQQRDNVREDGPADGHQHRFAAGQTELLQNREAEQSVRSDERADQDGGVEVIPHEIAQTGPGRERQ